MGKRGPKKRTDLDAIWEMRKLVEGQGLSERSASQTVARGKPYTWETLRKAYSELKESGKLPDRPPVSEAHQELVRRRFQQWRATLKKAQADREALQEQLREIGIDPADQSTQELFALGMGFRTRREELERLATSSPSVAVDYATRLYSDEASALAAIQDAKVEYEELGGKLRTLTGFIEARETIAALEAKLYPDRG